MDQTTYQRAHELATKIKALKTALDTAHSDAIDAPVSPTVQKLVRVVVIADLKEQLEAAEAEFAKVGVPSIYSIPASLMSGMGLNAHIGSLDCRTLVGERRAEPRAD